MPAWCQQPDPLDSLCIREIRKFRIKLSSCCNGCVYATDDKLSFHFLNFLHFDVLQIDNVFLDGCFLCRLYRSVILATGIYAGMISVCPLTGSGKHCTPQPTQKKPLCEHFSHRAVLLLCYSISTPTSSMSSASSMSTSSISSSVTSSTTSSNSPTSTSALDFTLFASTSANIGITG